MALFNKTDFIGIVPMSVNVPDANVNLHCEDAQQLDTRPIMPTRVNGGQNLLDDIVNSTTSTRPELHGFYTNYILKFMVCKAHSRFLLWQGNNITQFGVRSNIENTSEPVSDKTRSELIASSEHKANIYLAQLTSYLDSISYTLDDIKYGYQNCNSKPKAKTRIYAI